MSEDDKYGVIKKARDKMKEFEDRLNKRPTYYDRKGRPLELMEYARLFQDMSYRIVGATEIPATSRFPASRLSTVWLGIDHNFLFLGPPVLFETMRFALEATKFDNILKRPFHPSLDMPDPHDPAHEYTEQIRYRTEEQASLGHAAIIKLIHELELT